MKKLMMMAVMFVASATAFAGESDVLKAILKAKTYAEANDLLTKSLDQLASPAEKAKAYNKLVDLAMADFDAQNEIQLTNQAMKKNDPVDQNLMVESAYNALQNGIECDKYDQLPNEKNKVKPAFAEKNAQRLFHAPRFTLVNAGQDAAQNRDNAKARKYWEIFVLSDAAPLFANCDRTQQKEFFGQVARFAAVYAYQDKDMETATKLCDIAMKDPQEYEGCLNLKLEILGDGLKSHEDSVAYCNKLKDLYAEHKTDGVMEKLYNTLLGIGEKDAAYKVLDDALAENPNNFVALADKGLGMLNENPAEAATYLKKACELKSDNAALQTYAGTALSIQAQNTEDPNAKKALYKEAIGYYDKAKELDPERLQSNWGYNRYNAYYNFYGEDAPETKQAEEDSK